MKQLTSTFDFRLKKFFSIQPEALSEESHKIMRQMISEFVENIDDITLDFPPGMAQHERKFVEAEAKRLNLKFSLKPSGKGEAICSISKPKQS